MVDTPPAPTIPYTDFAEALEAPPLPAKLVEAVVEQFNSSAKGESLLLDLVQMSKGGYVSQASLVSINQQYLLVRMGYRWPYDSDQVTEEDIAIELPFAVTDAKTCKEALQTLQGMTENLHQGYLVSQKRDS